MPEQRPAVSVIAAVHDEASNVEELVQRTRTTMDRTGDAFEIVLVDDGSRDETATILRRLEAADARIQVYELTRNFGQNAALACGLFAARGDAIVTLDADLQNPPEEIPKLLGALASTSVATGRRATRYEGWLRWFASRSLHWLACWVTGVWIQDFGGNFKAYRREVIDALRKLWAPPKHLFAMALQLGFSVSEVTVRHDPRKHGHSQYTVASVLWININYLSAHTTLPLFTPGVIGACGMVVGAAGAAWCWSARDPHGLIAAVFLTLFVAGAPLCTAGALGLYVRRIHRRSVGGMPPFVLKAGPRRARVCDR